VNKKLRRDRRIIFGVRSENRNLERCTEKSMKPSSLIEKIKPSLLTAALLLIVNSFAAAQPQPSLTFTSFERARQVLDAALAAHGGPENIRRADKITINYKAVNHPLGQNAAFDAPPADFERVGAKTLIDYSGGRYVTEGQSNSAGGYKFNFRFVISPKRSFSIDVLQNRRGNEARNLDERTKNQLKIGLLSEVPHLFLLYVAQRPETLRYLGETEIDGRKLRAIGFADENGAQTTLYFDAATNLLSRTEQLHGNGQIGNAQLGDITFGSVFIDYRTIGSVKIPKKRIAFANRFITAENEYAEVKLDFSDGEKLLDIPAGFVESATAPQSPAAGTEAVKKMGDGVFLIEQFGYRVMFAEFDAYTVVLEAPTNAEVSKAVIRLVKQTAPDKPIKYVGFSHFHFDHTGGLREYIAEGATVVVPPGNKNFVEQIAKSKFAVKPDTLSLKPRPPLIETFEKKRVFTDGARTIELYSIGPTSHVDEMVIFYFPKEKILFQGDMFSQLDQGGIPPIIEINRELVKKVAALKLDVETLVGVHSGAALWKDFAAAVNKRVE
jgi:glyoxylase-like metal-dependent hydrolase (beta-lactamase superfamily II)